MVESDILASINPLVLLNQWARLPWEQKLGMDCTSAIYAMKNRIIRRALDLGMATMRLVEVHRPCKTCRGTGTYHWVSWYDDDERYEDCRRCSGTPGKVVLKFAEVSIGRARFHTPSNKADFLRIHPGDWNDTKPTEWVPEQPGRPLTRTELFFNLNEVERALIGDRFIRWDTGPYHNPYHYHLVLPDVEECFVCGRRAYSEPGFNWIHWRELWRPGLKWRYFICPWAISGCQARAERWPRQWPAALYRECCSKWEDRYSKDLGVRAPLHPWAHDPVVTEWLGRRGIVIGQVPPGELHWWRGELVDVLAVRGDRAYVHGSGWMRTEYGKNVPYMTIPLAEVRGMHHKEISACS